MAVHLDGFQCFSLKLQVLVRSSIENERPYHPGPEASSRLICVTPRLQGITAGENPENANRRVSAEQANAIKSSARHVVVKPEFQTAATAHPQNPPGTSRAARIDHASPT